MIEGEREREGICVGYVIVKIIDAIIAFAILGNVIKAKDKKDIYNLIFSGFGLVAFCVLISS